MKKEDHSREAQRRSLNKPVASHSAYKVIRNVTKKECRWLERTIKKGEMVYIYHGSTYRCISPRGSAFTLVEHKTPFFELPNDAVVHCGKS